MNAGGGYVRVYRGVYGHPVFRDGAEEAAFIWMIGKAAWQPTRLRYKERIFHLKRGQLALSQRDFCRSFSWSKGTFYRFLNRLKTEAMVGTQAGAGVTIITICNYDIYQAAIETVGAPVGAPVGAQAGHKRGTEQRKEEKKESPLSPPKGATTFLPSDWKPPPIGELPPKAQESARQWPAGAYDRTAESFSMYWQSRRKGMADWNKTWAGWILREHWKVMQESRRDNGKPAGKPYYQLVNEGRA